MLVYAEMLGSDPSEDSHLVAGHNGDLQLAASATPTVHLGEETTVVIQATSPTGTVDILPAIVSRRPAVSRPRARRTPSSTAPPHARAVDGAQHGEPGWFNRGNRRAVFAVARFSFVASAAAAPWLLLRHCVKSKEKSHGTLGEVASRLELRGCSPLGSGRFRSSARAWIDLDRTSARA
jgi:hypothetical protein